MGDQEINQSEIQFLMVISNKNITMIEVEILILTLMTYY